MEKLTGHDLKPGKWYKEHDIRSAAPLILYVIEQGICVICHTDGRKIVSFYLSMPHTDRFYYTQLQEIEELLLDVDGVKELVEKWYEEKELLHSTNPE